MYFHFSRTRTIRWNLMLINFGEVLTVLAFIAILYERVIEPSFLDFGKQPVDLLTIFLGLLEAIMPGIILFVCGFYLLLHCWMNAFAELMRFADRMFYKVSVSHFWLIPCLTTYGIFLPGSFQLGGYTDLTWRTSAVRKELQLFLF